MPIRVACKGCSAIYSVADEHAGKRMKCKRCGGVLTIPTRSARQELPLLEEGQDDAMERLLAASAAAERAPSLPSASKLGKQSGSSAKKSAKGALSIGGVRIEKRAMLLVLGAIGAIAALITIAFTNRPLTLIGLTIAMVGNVWFVYGYMRYGFYRADILLRSFLVAAVGAGIGALGMSRGEAPSKAKPAVPATIAKLPADIDGLLTHLKTADDDSNERQRVLDALAKLTPIEARRTKWRAIDPFLDAKQSGVDWNAFNALDVWASQVNLPRLLKIADEKDEGRQRKAIRALAKVGGAAAAAKVAEQMHNANLRAESFVALGAMGAAAEEPAIALLSDPDDQVRSNACIVLADVGGPKAIAALTERIEKEGNDRVRTVASTSRMQLQIKVAAEKKK